MTEKELQEIESRLSDIEKQLYTPNTFVSFSSALAHVNDTKKLIAEIRLLQQDNDNLTELHGQEILNKEELVLKVRRLDKENDLIRNENARLRKLVSEGA